MEPEKDESAVVDLIDTILNKGAIVHADVIISLADIPLIGINLNLALGGIETMLNYGMMEAWDQRIRKYYKIGKELKPEQVKKPIPV